MNYQQQASENITKKEWLRINSNQSFVKVQETKLLSKKIIHINCPSSQYHTAYHQQHSILVYFTSQHQLLKKIVNSGQNTYTSISNITIVPANTSNKNYWQNITTQTEEAILLTIDPQVIAQLARETINLDTVELQPVIAQSDPLIQHIALNLKTNLDSNDYDKLYAESLFNTLAMHLLRHYTAANKQSNHKGYYEGLPPYKLKKAIDYINDHLDCSIQLKDIAQLLEISQFYFCHLFKKSMGIAPYKYVIIQRVKKAKQLIKQSKLPLSDIAYECGFSSQSQMTQHFRKYVGVTPKVYRNN